MTMPDPIDQPLVILHSSLNEDSFIFVDVFFAWVWSKLLDSLSTLSRFRLCSANDSVRYPDETPRFVEYFSFLPLL